MLWELGNHLLALSAPSLNPENDEKLPNEKKLSGTLKRINENNKNFTVVSEPTLKKLKWENSAASCSTEDTFADMY